MGFEYRPRTLARFCVRAVGFSIGVVLGTFGTLWMLETFFPYEPTVAEVQCEPVAYALDEVTVYFEQCDDGTTLNFHEEEK